MKKIATLAAVACAAAVMFVPGQASAESAELRITGTFVPAACTMAFAGGGVIDYGAIPASSLNPSSQNSLESKSTQLTLTCEAPALFAFKVIDERAGTALEWLQILPIEDATTKFGLGTVDGKKIGAYSLQVEDGTSEAGYARRLESQDGGAHWTTSEGVLTANGGKLFAFGDSSSEWQLLPHTSITADIGVFAVLDAGDNLPLAKRIPLDGLSTFELIYL